MRRGRTRVGTWFLVGLVAGCALNPQPDDPLASEGDQASGGTAPAGAADITDTGGSTGRDEGTGATTAAGGSAAPTSGGEDAGTAESWEEEELVVAADSGWVDSDTNSLGVQGGWYAIGSEGTADLAPAAGAPLTNAGDGTLCVSGVAPQVVDGDTVTYFGAGIGFDLCASGADETPAQVQYAVGDCPYNPDLASQLLGISFSLSGSDVPSELRVVFKEAGRDESAYVLAGPGENVALVANAGVAHDPDAPPVNRAAITAIYFLVPAAEDAPTPFDFCISDVALLLPATTGAAGAGGAGGAGGAAGAL
jgi:hypothetical protein